MSSLFECISERVELTSVLSESGADVTLAMSSMVQPLGNFHTSRKASPMFLLGAPPCSATCHHHALSAHDLKSHGDCQVKHLNAANDFLQQVCHQRMQFDHMHSEPLL